MLSESSASAAGRSSTLTGGAGTDAKPRSSSGSGGSAPTGGRGGAGRGGSPSDPVRGGAGGAAAATGRSGAGGSTPNTGKLYADDFEDGDLTKPSWIDADPELGGKWQVVAADGGKVLAQTAEVSDWVIAAGGDYRWTDQVVEARVKITSEPGKAGIFARLRDTRNYYFLYIDGGSNVVLRKRVDNSSGDIQKMKIKAMANTWYTLKLSVIGSSLQGFLDGDLVVSGSDSGIAGGGIGVGTSDCSAQFDDISVTGG